jgi:hypothetical protein
MRACLRAGASALLIAFSAQVVAQITPPPVFPAVDSRGVDVATGEFTYAKTDVVIGDPVQGGIAFTRYYRSAPGTGSHWTHNHNGYITTSGGTCIVVIGVHTETFNGSCSNNPPHAQQTGSHLSGNDTIGYTYITRDGTVARFHAPVAANGLTPAMMNMATPLVAYLASVTTPDGVVTTYGYEWQGPFCYPSPEFCYFPMYFGRLSHITNNVGYHMVFEYGGSAPQTKWPQKVTGINTTVEYCSGWNCTQSWPQATYTFSSNGDFASMTGSLGHQTTYSYSGGLLTEVQFPDHADHDINISYASSRVTSVDVGYGMDRPEFRRHSFAALRVALFELYR